MGIVGNPAKLRCSGEGDRNVPGASVARPRGTPQPTPTPHAHTPREGRNGRSRSGRVPIPDRHGRPKGHRSQLRRPAGTSVRAARREPAPARQAGHRAGCSPAPEPSAPSASPGTADGGGCPRLLAPRHHSRLPGRRSRPPCGHPRAGPPDRGSRPDAARCALAGCGCGGEIRGASTLSGRSPPQGWWCQVAGSPPEGAHRHRPFSSSCSVDARSPASTASSCSSSSSRNDSTDSLCSCLPSSGSRRSARFFRRSALP